MEPCRVCTSELHWTRENPNCLCADCHELLDTMIGMQDPEWWWFFDIADEAQNTQETQQQQPPPAESRAPPINELLRRITSNRQYWQLGQPVQHSLSRIAALQPRQRSRAQNDYVRQIWQWVVAQAQQAVDNKVVQAISVF